MKSQYIIETGAFTGVRITGNDALLALNTPPGTAWVDGDHDARNRRCIVEGGQILVVAWKPDPPPESDNVLWVWDAAAELWCEQLKLPALKVNAKRRYLQQLTVLDGQSSRAVAEILEAQLLGQDPPAYAVERLQTVNAQKTQVRNQLTAIDQVESADDLPMTGI